MPGTLRRLLARFRYRRYARDLAEEIDVHRDLLARDLAADGRSEAEARDQARRAMGNELQAREDARAVWIAPRLDQLMQDVRVAFRQIRRAPAFSLTAIALAALGIGATTAVFSVVNALLLVPLPYPRADRLYALGTADGGAVDGQTFHAVAARSDVFSAVAAQRGTGGWSVVVGDHAEAVDGLRVSGRHFEVLGVAPRIGRAIGPDDDAPAGRDVAVISDRLWRRAFQGRDDALGQPVLLGGAPHEVVGVMPAAFRSTPTVDVWTPLRLSPLDNSINYLVIGRLEDDVPMARVSAELELAKADVIAVQPDAMRQRTQSLRWRPLQQRLGLEVAQPLLLLLLGVGATTAVACANLTGLLLVRTLARGREVATRFALGASRGRIARQFLTEHMLLAVIGGTIGLIAVASLTPALAALVPANLLAGRTVSIDGRVLLVAVGVIVGVGLIFGLAPVLTVGRFELRGAVAHMKLGTSGRRAAWGRRLLIAGEIAATAALLVLGGMLGTSLTRMYQADLGFDPDRVTVGRVSLAGDALADPARFRLFAARALDDLRAIPGVTAAVLASNAPVERGLNLAVDPSTGGLISVPRAVDWRYVSPDYFAMLGIPTRFGRTFDDRDGAGGAPVIIVNEAFARSYFSQANPVGEIVRFDARVDDTPRTIVGVVGNSLSKPGAGWTRGVAARGASAPPIVYVPLVQASARALAVSHQFFPATFMVRTDPGTTDLPPAIERAVRGVEPSLAFASIQPLEAIVADDVRLPQALTTIIGGLTAVALSIAAIGIFGLVTYATGLRRQETAVRIALGASRTTLVRGFVGEIVAVTLVGAVAGVALTLFASRTVAAVIGDLAAVDLLTVVSAVAVLIVVVGVAGVWPAAKAAREDPLASLRAP